MKPKCSECYYSWKARAFDGGQLWACDYIGKENKRRPCPKENCTAWKPKDGIRHINKRFNGGRDGI